MSKKSYRDFASSEPIIYRGWFVKPIEAIETGYKLPGSRVLMQQLGLRTHRKFKGYTASHPEEMPQGKIVSTIKKAKSYIDAYYGDYADEPLEGLNESQIPASFVLGLGLVAFIGIWYMAQRVPSPA